MLDVVVHTQGGATTSVKSSIAKMRGQLTDHVVVSIGINTKQRNEMAAMLRKCTLSLHKLLHTQHIISVSARAHSRQFKSRANDLWVL